MPNTSNMTASPGQQFIGLPSGMTYKADNSGNVANVAALDVLSMLKAGCSFAYTVQSGGSGSSNPASVPQTVTGSTSISATTTYVSINQTAAGTYTLAGGHADGFVLDLKDIGLNLSPTNSATFQPAFGETIDEQSSFVMTKAAQANQLTFRATPKNWDVS